MSDKTAFKKTLFLFKQESNRLLRSDWEESPLPFRRFLNRIETEPEIKKYLDDCIENHIPDGFDAVESVKAVAKDLGVTFVNFSTVPEEESAEVYLILREVVAQNIQGHSSFYYGFAYGSKYADMYKGFLDKVVRRLITNIEGYLIMTGIEMGLDDSGSVTNNNYGPVENMQLNQPTGGSTVNATQVSSTTTSDLSALLDQLLSAATTEIDDGETVEDVRDNVEIVRSQIEHGEPKRGVIKSFLGFLNDVNGGVQFTAAVVQIVEVFNNSGFQLHLPG